MLIPQAIVQESAISSGSPSFSIIPFGDWTVVAGTWDGFAFGSGTDTLMSGWLLNSSGTQNDEVTWPVFMVTGTWQLVLIHDKDTDRGIYTFSVDGSSLGTIDGYNGGGGLPNIRNSLTGFVVTVSGSKTLSMKMATKNASASAYKAAPQLITLTRTGN